MPNKREEPETNAGPVPGGPRMRTALSLIAGIALARCGGASLRLDRSGEIPNGPWLPAELERSKAAAALWKATMEATALTVARAETAARHQYDASVKRRKGAGDRDWNRFIDILARQSVEGLLPRRPKDGHRDPVPRGGQPRSGTPLIAHPLTEVRQVAAELRQLPDGGPAGAAERPKLPTDFDEIKAVEERYAGTIKAVAELPESARERRGPGHAAVDLVLYDPDADLLIAAGAAYETAGAPLPGCDEGSADVPQREATR